MVDDASLVLLSGVVPDCHAVCVGAVGERGGDWVRVTWDTSVVDACEGEKESGSVVER